MQQRVKSKFKIRLFFIVIPAIIGLVALMILLLMTLYQHSDRPDGVTMVIIGFLTITLLVVLRESRFKWNKIKITENELIVRPWFSLYTRRIRLSDITGYTGSKEHSKTSPGKVIYIYARQRRVVEISDAYYRNIDLLVAGLSGKVKKLGWENSSVIKHVLNAFGMPLEFREK